MGSVQGVQEKRPTARWGALFGEEVEISGELPAIPTAVTAVSAVPEADRESDARSGAISRAIVAPVRIVAAASGRVVTTRRAIAVVGRNPRVPCTSVRISDRLVVGVDVAVAMLAMPDDAGLVSGFRLGRCEGENGRYRRCDC